MNDVDERAEKYAFLRDTFFSTKTSRPLDSTRGKGELRYLKELLRKYKSANKYFAEFRKMNPRVLYNQAVKRINSIEYGEVEGKDLARVEGEICLLLGAIENLEKYSETELDNAMEKCQKDKTKSNIADNNEKSL